MVANQRGEQHVRSLRESKSLCDLDADGERSGRWILLWAVRRDSTTQGQVVARSCGLAVVEPRQRSRSDGLCPSAHADVHCLDTFTIWYRGSPCLGPARIDGSGVEASRQSSFCCGRLCPCCARRGCALEGCRRCDRMVQPYVVPYLAGSVVAGHVTHRSRFSMVGNRSQYVRRVHARLSDDRSQLASERGAQRLPAGAQRGRHCLQCRATAGGHHHRRWVFVEPSGSPSAPRRNGFGPVPSSVW